MSLWGEERVGEVSGEGAVLERKWTLIEEEEAGMQANYNELAGDTFDKIIDYLKL